MRAWDGLPSTKSQPVHTTLFALFITSAAAVTTYLPWLVLQTPPTPSLWMLPNWLLVGCKDRKGGDEGLGFLPNYLLFLVSTLLTLLPG